MTSKRLLMGLMAMILASATTAEAKIVYVNCNLDDYTDHDGKTMETAFRTLREGVRAANMSNDEVVVAPGVYDADLSDPTGNYGPCRLAWANRRLTVRSQEGSAKTFIVGRKSERNELGIGLGEGAVRCVGVYDSAGSILQGFTLCNGAVTNSFNAGIESSRGGAVIAGSTDAITLVDCVISNCSALTAGAVRRGTYVRTLVTDCICGNGQYLVTGSSATAKAVFVNSVLQHNRAVKSSSGAVSGIMFANCNLVNVSVLDNSFSSATYGDCGFNAYNSVIFASGVMSSKSVCEHSLTSDSVRSVMATLVFDPRVIAGSAAETAGLAEHLADKVSLPQGVDANVDFFGNEISGSGTIMAGAVQQTASPAAGTVVAKASVSVDGHPFSRANSYSYVVPSSYPTQYLFSVESVAGKRLCYYGFSDCSALSGIVADHKKTVRFPMLDDTLWVMPPAEIGSAITNTVAQMASVYWVDPEADAAVADGSESAPYRTIQAAADDASNPSVILCKRGVYNEGVRTNADYGVSRLHLPANKVMRVIGTEGAHRTFLVGQSDESATGDEYGRGSGAMRCLAAFSLDAIQGFTLTGGRTVHTPARSMDNCAGAAISAGFELYISDSIISNNAGIVGGAVRGAWLERCLVAGNIADSSIIQHAVAVSSVFSGNRSLGGKAHFADSVTAVNVTVCGDGTSPLYSGSDAAINRQVASVFTGGSSAPSQNAASCGNVVWDCKTDGNTATYSVVDPLLADPDNGDFRPFLSSPLFGSARIDGEATVIDGYWFYVSSDYGGRAIAGDGKIVPGAIRSATDGNIVAISAPHGGLEQNARIRLESGETMEILPLAGASRPIVGVTVNGVTNLFATMEGPAVAIDAAAAAGGIDVRAIYSSEWYISCDGADGNSGYFASDPKKNFDEVFANAVAGDSVVVLPGVYDYGEMEAPGSATRSRVVVPAGIELRSANGPLETVIVGQAGMRDESAESAYGIGEGAMRCVYLSRGAKVSGFTLKDGCTAAGTEPSGANNNGGGAYGAGSSTIENCFVTNCAAYRGGGAFGVTARKCFFVGGHATYGGGSTSDSSLFGCISRDNTATAWSVNRGVFYSYRVEDCTILDSLSQGTDNFAVTNTLVLGAFFPNSSKLANFYALAAASEKVYSVPSGMFAEGSGNILASAAKLKIDESYRPVIGENLAIDSAVWNREKYIGERDITGRQRVYNGALDIGAVEADWRGVYSTCIAKRAFAVEEASELVHEVSGAVRLPPGATLAAEIGEDPSCRTLTAEVAGGGTLSVALNGETIASRTGAGVLNVDLPGAGELSLNYDGEDGWADVLSLRRLGLSVKIR